MESVGIEALWYALTGVSAGLLGSILGLGGGILIVPILSILLGLPMHQAVAASLVGVVATSTSSSAGYMKRGLPMVRLGLTLELTTVLGAVAGSTAAGLVSSSALKVLFGFLLFYTAFNMWRGRKVREAEGNPDDIAATPLALTGAGFAGAISGSLGVGGGVVKVPILNMLLGCPIHRSTATSTYMMGITAAAGLVAYHVRDQLLLHVAAPLVVGVLIGGRLGPRVAERIEPAGLRRAFVFVLLVVAVRMFWGALA
jgi:uncharacterized membrane protein YfcA